MRYCVRKLISYSMVLLLVIHLFSGLSGSYVVNAADDNLSVTVQMNLVDNADGSKKELNVIYTVSGEPSRNSVTVERTVTKDGTVVTTDTDISVSDTNPVTETYAEDGRYTVRYRIKQNDSEITSEYQEKTETLDNTAPEVNWTDGVVVDADDISLNLNIVEKNLNTSSALQLSYKRTTYYNFSDHQSTTQVAIPVQTVSDDEGNPKKDEYQVSTTVRTILTGVGSGIYEDLKLIVTDKSGNKSEHELTDIRMIIDKDKPECQAQWLGEDDDILSPAVTIEDVDYYNKTCKTLVIQIGDLQMDASGVSVILKNGEQIINPSALETVSDYIQKYTYAIEEDGDYQLSVAYTDCASNSITMEREFIKDATFPDIQIDNALISYKNGTALPAPLLEDGKERYYLNQDVRFSFHVIEANYKTANVSVRNVPDDTDETEFPKQMTDNPQKFAVDYTDEGNYSLYAWAKDAAGNETKSAPVDFVIDKTAPVISVSGAREGLQTKEEVNLCFRIKETNPDYKNNTITVSRSDLTGYEERTEYRYEADKWDDIGNDTIERSLTFSKEGIYEVSIQAKDKAGNTENRTLHFTIDHTAPEISHLTYSNVEDLILPKYNLIFSNKVVALEFDVWDRVTGVNDEKVYVTVGNAADRKETSSVYLAHKVLGNRYVVYIPSDMGVKEFNRPVTIWAEDNLGNENKLTSHKVIYTTDYSDIKMTCDVDYNEWTNKDVTFHTTITDTKAGIDKIVYTVNQKVVKTVSFDHLVDEYECDITASESASVVSGYAVEVEVTNNCGTVNKVARQVYIDKQAPVVELTGVTNGRHYNTDCRIATKVNDVSYTNTHTEYVIKKTMEGKEELLSSGVFRSGNYVDYNYLTMINEGIYEIYAITTDSAGNQSVSNRLNFVIDKTAPVLSITGTENGQVSGKSVTLNFACEEIFYESNRVNIQVERTLDGQTRSYSLDGFLSVSKVSNMSHTFTEDGTYKVTMSAVDAAGNVAVSQTRSFTIDQTKPVISIEGTTNYQLWNQALGLSFVVEESYYASNHVSVTGTRTDIDGETEVLQFPAFVNSGKVSSLRQEFVKDGVYDLVVSSKDEAGNTDKKEVHFTIDKNAPEIYLVESFDGGYYQEFQLSEDLDDIFKDLTVISYKILLNGIEYNGIDKITDEGKYNLYVEATDELGHNTVKTAEFIIDHTAPKVIFTGVKNGETLHEKGQVLLSLTNTDDEIVSVRLNGEELGADIRCIDYTEYGSYKIDVDCQDKAGNKITRSIYFVYANPFTIAVVGGVAVVLILSTILWLWIRTRKIEKEENRL